MRRVRVVVVGALGVALLVGCSPSGPDQREVTAPPAATPTPAATATPTPTSSPAASGASDLSDPELGIVFTDFPRDQDEQTAAAVEAYMLFEIEFWKALTTNVVPPGPWAVASDEAIAWIQAQVGPNSANGTVVAGQLSTAITLVSADAASVVLDSCHDLTGVAFVRSDGSTENAVAAGQDATSGARLFLVPSAGSSWKVDTYEVTGPC
ncbi:hypothetical protein [Actinotalea sp. C106]|uniref:hypothetical protein n=1 Tax=Actinotalea sp. C106 TaxID=2908644 RepID=UPI002027869A|nr:hypothetical protein [Actinotalea sp. C106]